MRNQRSLGLEFWRKVVEGWLSGKSRSSQLYCRYNITPSLLYHSKKQYSRGKFNDEATERARLGDRIERLERLMGRPASPPSPNSLCPNIAVQPTRLLDTCGRWSEYLLKAGRLGYAVRRFNGAPWGACWG